MIQEKDELVRIICGQLLRDSLHYGLELASFFPEGYNERLYDDFPPSTQGNLGWAAQFDGYIQKIALDSDIIHP